MSDHDDQDEFHQPHHKEVQLGYDPETGRDDPEMLPDDELDSVWDEACTVEEAKLFLDILAVEAK